MVISLQYVFKFTSELTREDVQDILVVLNGSFGLWGDKNLFEWKYLQNPYGDSGHILAYVGDTPVGTAGFWRNDLLSSSKCFQCVDLAVLSGYRRLGVFKNMLAESINTLVDSYHYTFPNWRSGPGFLKDGWTLKRQVPITFHLVSRALKKYKEQPPISDEFVRWRFEQHPSKQYYACRSDDQFFLLTKRRKHCYAAGALLEKNPGLPLVNPKFLLSYDFPTHPIKSPRHIGRVLENTSYQEYDHFLWGCRADGW